MATKSTAKKKVTKTKKPASTAKKKITTSAAKKRSTASVKSAQTAVKKLKFSDVKSSVSSFFKNLDKAYYVAFLAIISIILFFMPWLNITVLSKLYETLNIDFLSGVFAIPQTLLSVFFSVDAQVNGLMGIIERFATVNDNLNSLHELTQYINTICSVLGIQVAANGETVNSIIASIQSALPSQEQLLATQQSLLSIASLTKTASIGVTLWVLVVVGFNTYTAIVCIAKKTITKGCTAAFIIEAIFVFIFILICLVVNSVVQSLVFFLPNVLEPTGWAWLTLIVCVIGIILCTKYRTKKSVKK